MPRNSVTTRTAEFFIDENGIFRTRMLPDVLVDELDVYDNNLVIRNITGGKKMLRLFDARARNWKMTEKAKSAAKKQYDPQKTIALAMLVNSSLGSGLLNFFKRLASSAIHQKYFSDEEEAVQWLLSFKK